MTGDQSAYGFLARRDEALAHLIALHGRPDPFSWDVLDGVAGEDAFGELTLDIVSQQISTAAAVTIYGRIPDRVRGTLDPAAASALEVDDLRAAGVSPAKARALRDLAQRVLDGRLSFERLEHSDDATAQTELEAVHGIGPWSAQMFLLYHLRRTDSFSAPTSACCAPPTPRSHGPATDRRRARRARQTLAADPVLRGRPAVGARTRVGDGLIRGPARMRRRQSPQ